MEFLEFEGEVTRFRDPQEVLISLRETLKREELTENQIELLRKVTNLLSVELALQELIDGETS